MPVPPSENNEFESSLNIQTFLLFMVAMAVGLLVAVVLLPSWMPNLSFSLGGAEPKAFWYLSRATAFISLSLLWVSMALGLGITNKMARLWPGAPAAFAIHEYVSLLGLAFAMFHALIILGDKYINFTLLQLLVPFSTVDYKPFWVGLGQIGFYTWALVALSFYIRPTIGQKTWRLFHYLTFGLYFLGLFHGIFSGTDSSAGWAQQYYWFSGASLLFLLFVRILTVVFDFLFPQKKQRPAPAARPSQGSLSS
jgi:predicted ferric reductase